MLLRKIAGIIFAIILIGLGFASGTLSTSCSQGAMSKKYEYKLINITPLLTTGSQNNIESAFNKMGAEGWEYIGSTMLTFGVFKR
jgi:hypothetical protein